MIKSILQSVSNAVLPNTLSSGNSDDLQALIFKMWGRGNIYITGDIDIDKPIEIPERITLVFIGGRLICPELVRIYGSIKSLKTEIFTHKVAFKNGSVKKVHAEWFGKKDYAIRTALYSANNIPVHLSTDTYMQNLAYFESNQTLIIKSGVTLTVDNTFKNKVIFATREDDTVRENITIIGGRINGTLATDERYEAVHFKNVKNAYIEGLRCKDVYITHGTSTGNILLEDCYDSIVKRVFIDGSNKMGVFIKGGSNNRVSWGNYKDTKDSAIGIVNSPNTSTVYNRAIGAGVNDFGGASGLSLNAKNQNIYWNFVSGSNGNINGNGITVGHVGASASGSNVMYNHSYNNGTKGIYVQGGDIDPTIGVKVMYNIANGNGKNSDINVNFNSSGVGVSQSVIGTEIAFNELIDNIQGISLNKDSKGAYVHDNDIEGSFIAIRNDAIDSVIENNTYIDNEFDLVNQENSN